MPWVPTRLFTSSGPHGLRPIAGSRSSVTTRPICSIRLPMGSPTGWAADPTANGSSSPGPSQATTSPEGWTRAMSSTTSSSRGPAMSTSIGPSPTGRASRSVSASVKPASPERSRTRRRGGTMAATAVALGVVGGGAPLIKAKAPPTAARIRAVAPAMPAFSVRSTNIDAAAFGSRQTCLPEPRRWVHRRRSPLLRSR